ncbi:MAG: hypothetical protein M3Q70_03335 [bacterium]|nr:hypothetical protein [bacterium]
MNPEEMKSAYGQMMESLNAEKLEFTCIRTGDRLTAEEFEAKWKATHPPTLGDNVIMFPVPEKSVPDAGSQDIAIAGF